MPKFWVSGEEADAIVTGVMSFTKEQVPLAAQNQLARRRAARAGRPAPGARLQLPRLPPGRRLRRRHPQGRGEPARGRGRRSVQRRWASRRRCSTTPTPRSAKARACTPTGCTTSCADPSRQGPALVRAAHADLRVQRGAAQHAHPLLRGAGPRALSRTPHKPTRSGDGGARARPVRQVAVHQVPRGGRQAAQPGAGQHGARPGEGPGRACGPTGSPCGWPTRRRCSRGPGCRPTSPSTRRRTRFPRSWAATRRSRSRRCARTC